MDKVHEFTVSMEFAKKWEDFMAKFGITTILPLLYQHITNVIFKSVIKESINFPASEPTLTTCETTPITQEIDALTYEEENAVRYVGGYVIQELKKDTVN